MCIVLQFNRDILCSLTGFSRESGSFLRRIQGLLEIKRSGNAHRIVQCTSSRETFSFALVSRTKSLLLGKITPSDGLPATSGAH
jgi:hypothetical protein